MNIETSLPENIRELIQQRPCNIQINANRVDVINGYGQIIKYSLIVGIYYRKCTRPSCKYDSISNPWFVPENHGRCSIEEGYRDYFICESKTSLADLMQKANNILGVGFNTFFRNVNSIKEVSE